MRILVLQETDWLDRNPILHHRMLEDLSSRGHEVVVVDFDILWAQRPAAGLVQRRREVHDVVRWGGAAGVTVIRPGMLRLPVLDRLSWLLGNARELRRAQGSWRPDVVVAYGISNAWLAQQWARRLRIPFVHHVMDALHTLAEPPVLAHLAKPVERAVLKRADHVIVVNNGLGQYARGMGVAPGRLSVLPMGTEVPDVDADGDSVRARFGFGERDVVLLFMGWLYSFAGLVELAQELARRTEELPDVKMLAVGDGDVLSELRELAATDALAGRLVVTGRRPVDEMPGMVAASDLCLLPADDNPTMRYIVPAKVVEYLQAGRPVLATPLPGLRAEFGDPEGLLWVRTPSEVLDRVRELGRDGESRRRRARELGAPLKEQMRRRPGWGEVTDRFEEILLAVRPAAAR